MTNGRLGVKDAEVRYWPTCPITGLGQQRAWHGWCYCSRTVGWHWVGW